jgi:pyruvate dehydrogenase E1 component beta subunit
MMTTFREAIVSAICEEMQRDDSVFIMGEDLGWDMLYTRGVLPKKFGLERARSTPISELAVVDFAVGAAMVGMRPIVELMFMDLLPICMDGIVNQAAKARYMTGGKIKVPLVIRGPQGGRQRIGPQHSQCLEAWFMHVPGIKVAIPSTPYDAKGLLKTAIRGDDPVLFFEHRRLYGVEGYLPEKEYLIPFGKAEVKKEGDELTIISTSFMVHESIDAAKELEEMGISAEVVDLRTLVPMDKATIINSTKKTGRIVIVEEGCEMGGVGAEISAIICAEAFDYMRAPIERVAALNSPIPYSPPLEDYVLPDKRKIVEAAKKLMKNRKI